MCKKAIFLDIDGTLVNQHGVIPPSARLALFKASEKGHQLFICTGRSKAEIPNELFELPFKGIVAAAGGYIEMSEQIIYEECIELEQLEKVIAFFENHHIKFYLEARDYVYTNQESKMFLEDFTAANIAKHPDKKEEIQSSMSAYLQNMKSGESLLRDNINKVNFMNSDVALEEIEKEFKDNFVVIKGSYDIGNKKCGDLMPKNVHKAKGIRKVLEYLQINQADTFAYGDSYNDIEMLQYVACGVAMNNGAEALKKIANDITDAPDEDGLYKSFRKYGLI